jgi:hypothetical protein
MKKCLTIALVFGLTLGWAMSETFARGGGGGRGGGGSSGGFRGGDFGGGARDFGGGNVRDGNAGLRNNIGNQQIGRDNARNLSNRMQNNNVGSRVGAAQNRSSQLPANFSSRNAPFAAGWFGDHPNAWRATHPHADAWAVAGLGAAVGWLGWGGGGYYNDDGTYDTSDDASDDNADDGNDDTTAGGNNQAADQIAANQPPDARQLAARGLTDVADDAEFLPLGVFAIGPSGATQASAVVQLSVSKSGILRGTYTDLVSDQAETVYGAIDRKSQVAAWTVGREGRVTFESTLANLTQANGRLALLGANGNVSQWTLSRYEETKTNAN